MRYKARAHFNNHLGLFDNPRPDEDELGRRAADHLPALDGYHDRDPVLASAHTVVVEAEDPAAACERVFALLNRDERPNRFDEPSLSVGDLVALEDADSGTPFGFYAVDTPVGFYSVPTPDEQHLSPFPTSG